MKVVQDRVLPAAALGALLLCGCAPPEAEPVEPGEQASEAAPAAEASPGVSDTEVVLGTHTDLTGPVAIWGVGIVNGARMRFDEANAAGGVHGRQIRFIVEDSGYKIPQAVSAGNKLINRDRIFAMVMAVGTPTNNAVMRDGFRQGVPNLFPATGSRDMVEPPHELMFSQMGLYYEEMRAGLKYFVEEMGRSTPCVISQSTDYGKEILDGAEDQAAQMGLTIAATSTHKPTEGEFTAAVLKLKNAGCDLVLMGTVHRDTILVLEAARKIGWEDVSWVGNEAAYGQVIADQQSGSGEGYYAFVPIALIYGDDDLSPPVRAWYDGYVALYDTAPGLPAMLGYRGADLTVKALEIAGRDLTRRGLIEALESISEYTDLFGNRLTFGPDDRKGVDTSVLSQIQDGRWVTLGESITY